MTYKRIKLRYENGVLKGCTTESFTEYEILHGKGHRGKLSNKQKSIILKRWLHFNEGWVKEDE